MNRARPAIARARGDRSLSRNIRIASVTLGCLCLAAAGVVILGRDRDAGSLPNYVSSRKAFKIAWVEPEQQAQFERNPKLAASSPPAKSETKAEARTRTASRFDDTFDQLAMNAPAIPPSQVPLPHARPRRVTVAAIPLPRERVATKDDTAETAAAPVAEPIVAAAVTTEPAPEDNPDPSPPTQPVKLMSYAPTREMLFEKEITRDITGSIGDPARDPDAGKPTKPDLSAAPAVTKLKTAHGAPVSPVRKPAKKLTIQERLWGPVQVASLGPLDSVGGLGRDSNGLPTAPYDRQTAVYVIRDKKVYMPDGSVLEAHSGYGPYMDDPRHAHRRMRGPTPPHVYNLKMRERLFHGVEAIRMLPIGGEDAIFGRDGFLTHSYLLGAKGQSHGCVSFKDYDVFLDAFKAGKITRLAVLAEFD